MLVDTRQIRNVLGDRIFKIRWGIYTPLRRYDDNDLFCWLWGLVLLCLGYRVLLIGDDLWNFVLQQFGIPYEDIVSNINSSIRRDWRNHYGNPVSSR